jgi:hypothetical protein
MSPFVGGTLLTGVVVSELQDGSIGRVSSGEEEDRRERCSGYRTGARGTRGRRVRGERAGRKAAYGKEPQKAAAT